MTPGQAMASRSLSNNAPERPGEFVSPQLAAFLAAERSRNPSVEPGLSDVAANFDSAQPPRPAGQKLPQYASPKSDRSIILAYVLWYFGGAFAAHRFYLGATRSAAVMAGLFWGGLLLGFFMSHQSSLSVGGLFVPPLWAAMILGWIVWAIVDIFLIPGLTKRANAPRAELAFT
jgi:hypothetical protein